MKYHLTEILDIEELKRLCEHFTNINGTVTAILDLEGQVLISTGWQSICTQFHRVNSETRCRCVESDTVLAGNLKKGQKYNLYKCKNGLVDIAMPIIIGDQHVANFFTGQFFLEKPDDGYFRNQARRFHFNETDYLTAVHNTPVFDESQIRSSISFLVQLTETIGKIGLKNLYDLELNKQLEAEKENLKLINEEYAALNEEYKAQNDELLVAKNRAEESEETYRMLFDSISDGVIISEPNAAGTSIKFIKVNNVICKRLGYTEEELLSKTPFDINSSNTKQNIPGFINRILKEKQVLIETEHVTKDGRIIPVEINTRVTSFKNRILFHSIVRDITERKQNELMLREKAVEIEAQNEEYLQINEELHQVNSELLLAKERAEESELILKQRNEELKQTVQQLFELDNRLQFTIKASNLGTWDWDIRGGQLNWSPACKKMFGLSPDVDMSYEIFLQAIHPNDREMTNAQVWDSLNEKKDYNIEYRSLWPDGSIHWISALGRGIYDENGTATGMMGVAMEITDRKKTELDLAHSHTLMSYIIEHTPISIAVFDKQLNYVYVSESYIRDFKVEVSQIIGKNHYDIFPCLPDELREVHQRALKGEIVSSDSAPYYHKDGALDWGRWECRPWVGADGTIGGIIIYSEIITDRVNQKLELIAAKEKAEESQKMFKTIADTSPLAIIISTGADEKSEYFNPAFEKLFGYTFDEIPYVATWYELAYPDPEYRKTLIAEWEKRTKIALENHSYIEPMVTQVQCKDGSQKIISWGFVSIGTKNWSFGMDLTEQKRTERELTVAKEKAEESDRLKTAFLQNMSHEIRTPMNAIMGFSGLMKDQFNNKQKIEQYSQIINQRCNDLLDVINDILDIAKIESGQLSINIEECNIEALFADISSFFIGYQDRLGKQHINLQLQAQNGLSGMTIYTDKVKLKQIFINLITNAFKFTDRGTIKGGCKVDENNNLIFYVSDTGIGIPLDKQKIVFERFAQLNYGTKRNIGGTGLGLPIVKGLVNLLGGEVSLESEPGKGSTFYFTIAYKTTQTLPSQSSAFEMLQLKDLTDKTILIVEDDLYNAEYIKEVLTAIGLNTLQADTGEEAVEKSMTQPVDLVLMDIRLPGIDGYEATRQIHLHKPNLKIIAQTAYASLDEKQKALNVGCSDYISKPTKQELLLSLVSKHLSK